jgi:hypothetical protein
MDSDARPRGVPDVPRLGLTDASVWRHAGRLMAGDDAPRAWTEHQQASEGGWCTTSTEAGSSIARPDHSPRPRTEGPLPARAGPEASRRGGERRAASADHSADDQPLRHHTAPDLPGRAAGRERRCARPPAAGVQRGASADGPRGRGRQRRHAVDHWITPLIATERAPEPERLAAVGRYYLE